MASLSGTQIKNTYVGLLKTSNNTAISASSQLVTDGAGGTTALSLSSSTVTAAALTITSVSQAQSRTKFLNWDASDGVVGFYDFTATDPAVSVSSDATSATVTIGTNAANDFTLAEGPNVSITQTGTTITIEATSGFENFYGRELGQQSSPSPKVETLVAGDSGKHFSLVNAFNVLTQILLPSASSGLSYWFEAANANQAGSFQIDCASGDYFVGGIALTNNGVLGSSLADTKIPYTMTDITSTGDNRITLSGNTSTSGLRPGSWVHVYAKDATTWIVEGHVYNATDYTEYSPSGNAIKGVPDGSNDPELFSAQ